MLRRLKRSLLEAKPDGYDDDDEDNADFNDLLSRDKNEYEIFTLMDKERELHEKGKRLIEWSELPEVYRNEKLWDRQDDEEELGKGKRKRATIAYDERATSDESDQQVLEPRKRGGSRKGESVGIKATAETTSAKKRKGRPSNKLERSIDDMTQPVCRFTFDRVLYSTNLDSLTND